MNLKKHTEEITVSQVKKINPTFVTMKKKNILLISMIAIGVIATWAITVTLSKPKIHPIICVNGKTMSQIDSIYGKGVDIGMVQEGIYARLYFEKDTIAGYTFLFSNGVCVEEIIVPSTPESFGYFVDYLNKKAIVHEERMGEMYGRQTKGVNAKKVIGKWDMYFNTKPTTIALRVGEKENPCYFINTSDPSLMAEK